ncbi:hypothetical protein PR048_022238 [Dryococelus australis]|uniref:Uncharacterized protein n=1 Tax=Dryococelus australis TaxID=614101 RepID=A0ABQ9H0I9_9NEOP|nr:hypothetical protein PR048_022238 [Dryococelus australis]
MPQKIEKTHVPPYCQMGQLLRGRLTDKTISELQQYYGIAIRNNTHDLESMRKAICATYFHKLSNDEKPIHSLCPSGPNTCQHRDLVHPDLLRKCLLEHTQNPNNAQECICGDEKTLKWRVCDAVLIFNDGNIGRIRELKQLNIVPCIHTVKGLQLLDKTRIAKAQRVANFNTRGKVNLKKNACREEWGRGRES